MKPEYLARLIGVVSDSVDVAVAPKLRAMLIIMDDNDSRFVKGQVVRTSPIVSLTWRADQTSHHPNHGTLETKNTLYKLV